MGHKQLQAVVHYIHQVAKPVDAGEATDGMLMDQFLRQGDESAYATLVRRHGPLVLIVCQRVLDNLQDTEDAFQATFLVLLRKGSAIKKQDSLVSWLHGVARRVAVRLKTNNRRRKQVDRQYVAQPAPDSLQKVIWRDLRALLDEEIQRLPRRYRESFVLCYMQGKTSEETARLLGCPKGTIDSRLARARDKLRARLIKRGLGASAGLVATILSQNAVSACVPVALQELTTKSAALYATGRFAAGGWISNAVLSLTQEIVRAMFLTKLKIVTAIVLLVGLSSAGAGVIVFRGQAAEKQEANQVDIHQQPREDTKHGVVLVESNMHVDLTLLQLEKTQQEYLEVVSDLRKAEVEMALAKAKKVEFVSITRLDDLVRDDPRVKMQLKKIENLEAQLTDVRNLTTKEGIDEKFKKYEETLSRAKDELEQTRQLVTKEIKDHLARMDQLHFNEKLDKIGERVEFLSALKRALVLDMEQLEKRIEEKRHDAHGDNSKTGGARINDLEKQIRDLKAQVEELKKRK